MGNRNSAYECVSMPDCRKCGTPVKSYDPEICYSCNIKRPYLSKVEGEIYDEQERTRYSGLQS